MLVTLMDHGRGVSGKDKAKCKPWVNLTEYIPLHHMAFKLKVDPTLITRDYLLTNKRQWRPG